MTEDAILKTEDLRMVYHVGTVEVFALRGVDIQVQKGEFVSIVGPSGCGKSTLLHLLGGLARPTYGRIFVDGDEISAAADADRTRIRREKIGFVFQRFNLLPTLTVKGNLDSSNSTMILNLFRELNQRTGQTIMMITHNHEAAAVGHRIIEMRDGRVVSHGIVPHLLTGAGT